MNKILSLILTLFVAFATNAEIRKITITPESFDFDPSVTATTRQQLSLNQDGFAISAYCGIRTSTNAPRRFVFAGKALTTNGAFIAVTQNANNYKIINFEVEIAVKSLSSMMGMYTVRATDIPPTSPGENRINADEWTEIASGSTNAVEARSYEILPGMTYAGIFSNSAFTGEYNSIEITYDTGSSKPVNPGEKVEPTLIFSQKVLTYGVGTANVDLNPYVYNPEELPLQWSVFPDDGGIEISDGKLLLNKEGDYTVTAAFPGNDDYLYKEISIKVVVEDNLPSVVGEILPVRTSPADYEQLTLLQPLTEVSITFPALGDYGIEAIDRRTDNFITVYKDDEIIQKVPTTDRSLIYIDRNDYNKLWVKVGPIEESGKYKVKFPANLAQIDIYQRGVVNTGSTEAYSDTAISDLDFVKTHSAPYTLNMIITYKGVVSGVDSVSEEGYDVTWYDLQGNKVVNPGKGVFIKQSAGKTSKVILK